MASQVGNTALFSLEAAAVTARTRRAERGLYREPNYRTATYYKSAVPYLTRLLNSR